MWDVNVKETLVSNSNSKRRSGAGTMTIVANVFGTERRSRLVTDDRFPDYNPPQAYGTSRDRPTIRPSD